MAHYTVTASDHNQLIDKLSALGVGQEEHRLVRSGIAVGIIMGSDSDLPCMQDAAKVTLALALANCIIIRLRLIFHNDCLGDLHADPG